MPNNQDPYVVNIDASGIGLDVYSCKNGRVMANTSHQLKPHKKNYSTHDLKLVAVVFVLKIWRCYIYDVRFEVYFDHKSLKYLFTQHNLHL